MSQLLLSDGRAAAGHRGIFARRCSLGTAWPSSHLVTLFLIFFNTSIASFIKRFTGLNLALVGGLTKIAGWWLCSGPCDATPSLNTDSYPLHTPHCHPSPLPGQSPQERTGLKGPQGQSSLSHT